jgi:hypothetical protein
MTAAAAATTVTVNTLCYSIAAQPRGKFHPHSRQQRTKEQVADTPKNETTDERTKDLRRVFKNSFKSSKMLANYLFASATRRVDSIETMVEPSCGDDDESLYSRDWSMHYEQAWPRIWRTQASYNVSYIPLGRNSREKWYSMTPRVRPPLVDHETSFVPIIQILAWKDIRR